ncbi:ATP-binding protein [Anaerobranca gottschalkii]|uniref:DNA helicase HerA, contains HAS-barrel and ATPase domains n=1 Tax=Anaerobranca gottschalkii DSM 13577 TaxID=1120990 RepID=A0A1I0CA39_9FIRM|nr:ATP-binding protein [Anaerobranca gottschalkii]SET15739.1 DNA helicase HerA, contains HAS-barrel and ATPase domains [Anaerobranca gottschalkii DSM 13577]
MNEKNNNQQELMIEDNEIFEYNSSVLSEEQTSPDIYKQPILEDQDTINALRASLIKLGFINFDGASVDNSSSEAMVAAEHRKHFRRDVYVGISDKEQNLDFLGRVVEGPFHTPHEVGIDSAITRTTVLHPDRTQFRPSYYVTGTIEILGQLVENERLVPCPTRPRPYSEIYIFPANRLQKFLNIAGDFYLGHLMGYDKVKVLADVNSKNFLPRNIGVFGTVGSGKSNTTQVIIEEAINAGWAVVVVDVEGEYVRMNEPTNDERLIPILKDKFEIRPVGIEDFKVYVPQSGHSDAINPIRFKVPISALDPFVLSDLMELSEPQARLLESIMEKANSIHRSSSSRIGVLAQPNSQTRGYTLQTLIDGLSDGSLVPTKTIESTVGTLRSKLIRLGMSQMLDWNGTNSIPELPVNDLLVGGRLSVLDVSETDDRSRNIAIAYTLQALFDRVIQTSVNESMPNGKVRPKVLVVIEEVHTFVSRNNAAKMRSVLDNLQVISRRGRKRWMSLALVSQQPGHVPDELFELCNTRFIHQLKSASNLTPVKQTTGGVHEALWSNISSLGPGQCLITGAIFNNPLFVEIRPAKTKRMHST